MTCPLCKDNHTLSQCSRWRVRERQGKSTAIAALLMTTPKDQMVAVRGLDHRPVAWLLRRGETNTFSGGSVHQPQNLPRGSA